MTWLNIGKYMFHNTYWNQFFPILVPNVFMTNPLDDKCCKRSVYLTMVTHFKYFGDIL